MSVLHQCNMHLTLYPVKNIILKILMKYFLLQLLCLSIFITPVVANNYIDSLKEQLAIQNEVNKTDVLIELSKAYWTVSPGRGLQYSNEAVKLAKKHNDKNKEARALLYGGVNAYYLADYEKSIDFYQKSLMIAREINDERLSAYNLNNLGMVNSQLKNYEKAISNYSESSGIMKELGDKIEYAKIINNIGELNMLLGNYDEALKNHLSIVSIIKESGERIFLLWLLNDIGNIYIKKGNYEKALQYLFESLKISDEIDDNIGKTRVLNNIGTVYLKKKEPGKAKEYFYNGLIFAKKTSAEESLMETYRNLSGYYLEINNHKKALEFYKLFKEVSDNILNENRSNKIIEMQTRFETENKEKENNLLRKKNEVNELTIEKQTYLRNFFIVLLILSILLIILIYNRFSTKKKISIALEEKNNLITEQKNKLAETLNILQETNIELMRQKKEIQKNAEKLKSANSELHELNATKDKFFSIIAHDLKSPFNAMVGFSDLLVENFDEFNTSTQKDYVSSISQSVKNSYRLLENLLTWARSQMGNISFNPEKENICLLIKDAVKVLDQSLKNKSINLINKISGDLFLLVDKNMFSTIIRNLISNAVKFTPQGGTVELTARLINKNKKKFAEISVIDSGIGINPELKAKIFSIDNNSSTVGTEQEIGTGLGLIICKEFVEKHKGKIWVESETGKGSTFSFSIPVKTDPQ